MENTMENTMDNTQASKGLHDEEHQQGRLGRFVELVQAVFLRFYQDPRLSGHSGWHKKPLQEIRNPRVFF